MLLNILLVLGIYFITKITLDVILRGVTKQKNLEAKINRRLNAAIKGHWVD